MSATDHTENALTELRRALASYFSVSVADVRPLLSGVLISLEAEITILKKYEFHQEEPNFSFARDSIMMVAKRLKSKFLQEMCALLNSSASAKELNANIETFLHCIQEMRALHAKSHSS